MSASPRVIVTGAAGHLGSHLVPALVAEGFNVTGLDLAAPAAAPVGWDFVRADLADREQLKPLLAGAELIVHCASIHPWKQYTDAQYLDCNIKGTWNLYQVAAELKVPRIVLTSSISATGYLNLPLAANPISEDQQFGVNDLYGFTKHAQEDIARSFADRGLIRTIALRPPAFMPKSELETGFSLTGCFAVVADIAAAHVAAVRVMSGRQTPPAPLAPFEAFFVTNRLPYQHEDFVGITQVDPKALVRKYWPEAYPWLIAQGYRGAWLPAVYRVDKAQRLLGWAPAFNFEQWYASHRR